MRKGIKAKAFTIFLAWAMIFFHNVIPHNHLQENTTCCSDLIHNANPDESDCSGPLKFKSIPGEVHVCHISNFLYHQFSEDNPFIQQSISVFSTPVLKGGVLQFLHQDYFIREVDYGSSSRRAPPAA